MIAEIIDVEHRFHTPTALVHGREGYRQVYDTFVGAFPDVSMTIEEQIAEGDTVVTRSTWRGTQTGALAAILARGQQTEVPGITIHRLTGGIIVEMRVLWDTLALMQQMGVIPRP